MRLEPDSRPQFGVREPAEFRQGDSADSRASFYRPSPPMADPPTPKPPQPSDPRSPRTPEARGPHIPPPKICFFSIKILGSGGVRCRTSRGRIPLNPLNPLSLSPDSSPTLYKPYERGGNHAGIRPLCSMSLSLLHSVFILIAVVAFVCQDYVVK